MRTYKVGARRRGFTLVELMVVVAIVGVLGGLAMFSLRDGRYGGGTVGMARRLVSEIEACRVRALSTGRWQRIDVYEDRAVIYEGATSGMVEPVTWDEIRTLDATQLGRFWAAEPVTRAGGGMSLSQGTGMPFSLMFLPDGSSQPATIYLATPGQNVRDQMRVVVYRATGVAYLWEGW